MRASAPVRICDAGGWTDTWFAGSGVVCSLAVEPGVEVEVEAWPRSTGPERLTIDAATPGPHPLLDAAVAESGAAESHDLAIRVRSDVPPASAMGTSAAATVALLAALARVTGDGVEHDRAALARAAHRVETERLGLQSGIQDQLAAAFGGINRIEIDAYPSADVIPLAVTGATWTALDARLAVVYLGFPHASSAVHERVIAELEAEGPSSRRLAALRHAARRAAAALEAGDLDAYGAALVANNDGQRALHPTLVSGDAEAVIALATAQGASGWKVNGAGGDGGSVAVLAGPRPGARSALAAAVAAHRPGWAVLVPRLNRRGVDVRDVGEVGEGEVDSPVS